MIPRTVELLHKLAGIWEGSLAFLSPNGNKIYEQRIKTKFTFDGITTKQTDEYYERGELIKTVDWGESQVDGEQILRKKDKIFMRGYATSGTVFIREIDFNDSKQRTCIETIVLLSDDEVSRMGVVSERGEMVGFILTHERKVGDF